MNMPPPSTPQPPKASQPDPEPKPEEQAPTELPEVEKELTNEPKVQPSTIEERHDAIDQLQNSLLTSSSEPSATVPLGVPMSRAKAGEAASFNSIAEFLQDPVAMESSLSPVFDGMPKDTVTRAFQRQLEALLVRPIVGGVEADGLDGTARFRRRPLNRARVVELFNSYGHSLLLTAPGEFGKHMVTEYGDGYESVETSMRGAA